MREAARVNSLEALARVKAALVKFSESVGASLSSVDSDVQKIGSWLSLDRPAHWKAQIRRREDEVNGAKMAIMRKRIISAPEPASVVDERKVLRRAQARLERAKERMAHVKRWAVEWEREAMVYKTAASPLSDALVRDVPNAIADLKQLMAHLEKYLSMQAPSDADLSGGRPAVDDAHVSSAAASGELNIESPHRLCAPSAQARGAIRCVSALPIAWMAGTLNPEDAEAVGRMSVAAAPDGRDRIMLANRALREPGVVFVRDRESVPGDSGWYVGPLEQPERSGGWTATTVGNLLEQRPDLAPLLRLEPGTVLEMRAGMVRSVLDGAGRELWRALA